MFNAVSWNQSLRDMQQQSGGHSLQPFWVLADVLTVQGQGCENEATRQFSRDFAKTIYLAFRCFEKIKVKVFSTLKVLYQHQRIISKVFLAWKCEDYSLFYTYHNHPVQFQLEFCFVFNFFAFYIALAEFWSLCVAWKPCLDLAIYLPFTSMKWNTFFK